MYLVKEYHFIDELRKSYTNDFDFKNIIFRHLFDSNDN